MTNENDVYELDPGEQAGCYFCLRNGDQTSYGRGEAYLAGAGHTPWDGNANYVCKAHLDSDAVIHDPSAHRRRRALPSATPEPE